MGMVASMTGYGSGEAVVEDRRLTVEIRSVNNRYCDIQVRLPRLLAGYEPKVRERIGKRVQRGKLDVFLSYEDRRSDSGRVRCDLPLALAYARGLRQIAAAADLPDDVSASVLGRFPDVLTAETPQLEGDVVDELIGQALDGAVDQLCQMRQAEGARLAADIDAKIGALLALHTQAAERAPTVVEEYRRKLQARVDELLGAQAGEWFDEQRLAAEVMLFADRSAIDEELVRLESHLAQVRTALNRSGPHGKKLDFLLQEINREVNTIGSKAGDLELIQLVVDMKNGVEQIREQVQNLE